MNQINSSSLPFPIRYTQKELLIYFGLSVIGILISLVVMFTCRIKIGFAIVLVILILLFLKNHKISIFALLNMGLFATFLYNSKTRNVDLFLINNFRLTDIGYGRSISDIDNYIFPLFLVFVLLYQYYHKVPYNKSIQVPIKLLLIVISFSVLSEMVYQLHPIGTLDYLNSTLSFILLIIIFSFVIFDKHYRIFLLKYIFFYCFFLQLLIILVGTSFHFLSRDFSPDWYVGTAGTSVSFSQILFVPFLYFFIRLINEKLTFKNLSLFLLLTIFIILPQSIRNIIIAFITLAIIFLFTRFKIRQIFYYAIVIFILLIGYQNLDKVIPQVHEGKDYAQRSLQKYLSMGYSNPQIENFQSLFELYQDHPITLLLGVGNQRIKENIEELGARRDFHAGAMYESNTTFTYMFGGIGIIAGLSFYLIFLYFLKTFYSIYRRYNHSFSLLGIGILIYLLLSSLITTSFENLPIYQVWGLLLGLIFYDAVSTKQLSGVKMNNKK